MTSLFRVLRHVVARVRHIFGREQRQERLVWLSSAERDSFTAMSGWIGYGLTV